MELSPPCSRFPEGISLAAGEGATPVMETLVFQSSNLEAVRNRSMVVATMNSEYKLETIRDPSDRIKINSAKKVKW